MLVEEKIILACSIPYYKASIHKDHSLENLAKQDFITYRQDARTINNWFRHHFGKLNAHFHIVLTVDSHQAVISAIKHHVGLGIVASHLVKEEIQNARIIPIKTTRPEIINQISLVQLKDKIPTLTEKAFFNFLLKNVQYL